MIPSHAVIDKVLMDVKRRATHVGLDYRWLHGTAYERPKRGGSDRRSSDVSDVASVVAGTVPVRRHIEEAAKAIFRALRELERAQAELNDAATLLDRGMTVEPNRDERTLDHPADRGDLARARKAQERRNARAEQSGDYSEVVG